MLERIIDVLAALATIAAFLLGELREFKRKRKNEKLAEDADKK